MAAFCLSAAAKEDLKSIARYTQKEWGIDQRNRYLAVLDQSFHRLAAEPTLGRSAGDIREGYRKLVVRRHVIFYHAIPEGIKIVRVLHGSMDVDSRLSPEA